MAESLQNWLNNKIILSKIVQDIAYDFKNGYLFAELLYKTKQIPNLAIFKDSKNHKDIISNFCHLQKNFLDIGIILDEKSRDDIMNASPYASKIYLFKIKQVLSRKNIDLEQLKLKESTTIQNLYNKIIFKNDNEKYLRSWQIKYGIRPRNKRILKKNYSSIFPGSEKSTENILDEKYNINGTIYKEFKSKYSHLNFSEEEIRMVMEEMRKNEIKLLDFRNSIGSIENGRKLCLKKNDEEIKKKWEREHLKMENFKLFRLKESWTPAIKYKLFSQKYFKRSENKNIAMSANFDDNLKFLVDENDKNKKTVNSEIIMLRMRKKLDDNIKNKRDKEKRERKRLKEEQEMIELSTKRNNEMKNLKRQYSNIIKSEEINKNIDKSNEKKYLSFINNNSINNEESIKSRNVNRNKPTTESTNFQKLSEINNLEEEKQFQLNEIPEGGEEKLEQTKFSSYSRLSENDYGAGLFNDYISIHNNDIRINDRIKLFNSLISPKKESVIETQKINQPIMDLNNSNSNNSLSKIDNSLNIYEKSTTLNNSEEFNKIAFFEELKKLDLDLFQKEYKYKLNKLNRKIKLISPIMYQLIDLTEYIFNYQETKKIDLIDNPKWDELMFKFKENIDINENEEDKNKNEEEEENGNYLIDYGDKLTDEDDKKKLDYVKYINSFNDLIIPNEERGKKLSYPELYKDFYIKQNNQDVDIKEYEPNLVESENLYLPRNSKIKNYAFSDIIESIIENKYNDSQEKKIDSFNIINKYEKKGKYYYLPIKIVLNGYPLSGKKTQSHLIKEKYKGIKIYDPQKILRNKMREYLEIKAAQEESENNNQQQKPKTKPKKDEKTLEERIKDFKPVKKIIKPYLEFIDRMNKLKEKEEKKKEKEERKRAKERKKTNKKKKKTDNEGEESKKDDIFDKSQENVNQSNSFYNSSFMLEHQSEKEDILSDVYMKLILYQMEKDFPSDKNSKMKFLKNITEKYKEFLNLKEKIKDINDKIDDEKSKAIESNEPKSKNKKENKILVALNKELENAKKNFEATKNSLYTGFIFINFPKNLKEAEKIENYFTGYVSELDKGLSETEKKLFNYRDIIDLKVKKKTGIEHFSFFDLFIEFKVTSEEMNRRYKGAKYDSLTAVIYHEKDNPPPKEDKKVESRLTPGIPYMSKEEVYIEKSNYEINIKSLERLYRAMTNGFGKVYMSINQMDLNNLKNINSSLENAISDTIFNNYYSNVEIIYNNIIENNITKSNDNKDKSKEEPSLQIQVKEENLNQELIFKNTENLKNNLSFSEEILNELDEFHHNYQSNLKNLNHFIICQKENILDYLSSIQNIFISFLNRKTSKLEIADIYIQKYNDMIENHPDFKDNQAMKDELLEDIKDVAKSIWISIQNKKMKDIKYLQDLKNSGKKEKECDKFFEYISSIFELEVEKYLLSMEITIKFYLSKYGLLNDIYGIFDSTQKMNKSNKYLFKVNHKNFIFQGIEKNNKINKSKNKDENEEGKKEVSVEEKNEEINLNNIQTFNNAIFNKIRNQNIEVKINNLYMNSFKIIIRQDELITNYIDKIKNFVKHEKDKSNAKNLNSKLSSLESSKKLNNSVSSSKTKKKVLKKTRSVDFQNDIGSSYEELKNQVIKEKRKLKYRLMFLKYYSLRYTKIIKDCYNETYNTLDELIIMSVRFQNNTLNEFINYLKKSLNYFNKKINSNIFEFDTFDIFYRYRLDVNELYRKYTINHLLNTDGIKNKEMKDKNYIAEEELTYTQLYVYNLRDFMNIYHNLKLFGIDTCDFFVKFEIVNEILLGQYFNNKKYGKYENQKSEDEFDRNILNEAINEENNGICNKILFASNLNYINFLNHFAMFNNNFININELFTSLLILGSQLISSEEFFELIKEYLPENKKEEKNIFLTKEEFMELPMWFEKDDYLNALKDAYERDKFMNIFEENNSELDKNKSLKQEQKPLKINAVKEALFEINSEDGILELNKILATLNKLNNIASLKSGINKVIESDKSSINQKMSKDENLEISNKKEEHTSISNIENNKIDSSISKLNLESKMTSSLQSGNVNKISESKIKDKINNVFNILFN